MKQYRSSLDTSRIPSGWGPLAAVLFIQALGVVVYHGFLMGVSGPGFRRSDHIPYLIWCGLYILLFLWAEAAVLTNVRAFWGQNGGIKTLGMPRSPADALRVLTALGFGAATLFLILRYPFPSVPESKLSTLLFLAVSAIFGCFAKNVAIIFPKTTPMSFATRVGTMISVLLIAVIFFAGWPFQDYRFYVLSLFSGFLSIPIVVPLLLSRDE